MIRSTRLTALALALFAASIPARAEDAPFTELPYTPSLDAAAMDRTADPCEDLYQYSCGGWMKNNPLPGDQASWSVYGKLYQDNQRYLWGLLLDAAKPSASRSATQQRIGDYFEACMNVEAIEQAGATPLAPDLQRIASMKSIKDLGPVLGNFHARASTAAILFGSGVEQDAKESTQQIFAIYAGGLGLPDRDYYLKDDDKSKETRAKYVEHVAKMLQLAGDTPEAAQTGAKTVMRLETALAKASLTRVERRDPYKVYHHTVPAKLKTIMPSFDWDGYFAAVGGRPGAWLNVSEPAFFTELGSRLGAEPLEDIKTYLRWAVVSAKSDNLSKAFVDEHFAFYRAYLRGVKEDRPRWKKCVAWVDRDLGEALGKEFVDRVFPPENKVKAVAMTDLVVAAMKTRIKIWTG